MKGGGRSAPSFSYAARAVDSLPSGFPELRAGPPWVMEDMVAAEPTLPAGIVRQEAAARSIAGAIKAALAQGQPIAVAGCGTSEHGAMGVAEQLRDATGDQGRIHARQAFEAALDPWSAGLCIGISHEGETKATVAAMRAAREAGAATALITAAP